MRLWKGRMLLLQIVPKFNNQGKTVGLLLHVLEPIFGKGNMVVLDSRFCILKGIMELEKHGVYASALIKKQKYWPKYIKAKAIKQHFEGKQVGDCNSWKGNMDEVPFHVYAPYCLHMGLIYKLERKQVVNGWMGVAQSNKRHSTTLRS